MTYQKDARTTVMVLGCVYKLDAFPRSAPMCRHIYREESILGGIPRGCDRTVKLVLHLESM